uniref:Uncharacterized protein n=1 Tax=Parascaris equorum TaxID=6256 RepID=A0A914R670_PAREQ
MGKGKRGEGVEVVGSELQSESIELVERKLSTLRTIEDSTSGGELLK